MSSKWIEIELQNTCSLIKRGITPKYLDNAGVIVVNQRCIRNQRLSLVEARYHDAQLRRIPTDKYLQGGDVLINSTGVGTLGRVAQVKNILSPMTADSHVTILRADQKIIDKDYFGWFLRSKESFIETLGEGSTGQTELSRENLYNIKIRIPPRNEQISISNFLNCLDQKIELNRQMCKILEEMATALFKSWFVDFDPVRAKAEGRQPEGIDAETAALFPDSFEETELGLVPKGWRVSTLNDICKITSGKRPCNRSDMPTFSVNIPLYGGAGVMGFTTEALYSDRKILTGRVGTLGQIHIANPPFWASDNVLVLSPINIRDFYFCLHWLRVINMYTLNRGSTQPLLTQKDLGNQKNTIPSNNLSEVFADIITPLYNKISECSQQYQTLTSLRDTLLPRLISGQLKLPEIGEIGGVTT